LLIVGWTLGSEDGTVLGLLLGLELGADEGIKLGTLLGSEFGKELGLELGFELGSDEGIELSTLLGLELGLELGFELGFTDGSLLAQAATLSVNTILFVVQPNLVSFKVSCVNFVSSIISMYPSHADTFEPGIFSKTILFDMLCLY
jgi:hypothetical protein